MTRDCCVIAICNHGIIGYDTRYDKCHEHNKYFIVLWSKPVKRIMIEVSHGKLLLMLTLETTVMTEIDMIVSPVRI